MDHRYWPSNGQFTDISASVLRPFYPSCFDESVELQSKLVGGTKRKLKADTVPSIFSHRLASKVRTASVARAAEQKRQEVRINLLYRKQKFV